jgi:hypothetical protein
LSAKSFTSVLNGGFQLGATVTRSDEAGRGQGGRQSNKFDIYSPKVIAMVGNPEELFKKTTLDRSFRIRMERQTRRKNARRSVVATKR